jgi:hypothetical protein
MPIDTQHRMGVVTTFKPDAVTGVFIQNAASTESSAAAMATDAGVNYGTPMVLSGAGKKTADGTTTITFFSKNCPCKLLIVGAWHFIRTMRTGGTPDHKLKLEHGDGAGSESFNDITSNDDLDGDTPDAQVNFGTISDAYATIGVGESLKGTFVVGGSTTTGTSLVDVHVMVVPIK